MTRLPDLYVIGAYKCGTTMLQHTLESHPDIFVPTVKEPNYWAFAGRSDDEVAGEPSAAWSIRDRASYERLFAGVTRESVVAEVSPEYLHSAHARRQLADLDPRPRLVAILRDPVDRAYSDFMMYRRDGVEPLDDFAAAIADQDRRRAAGLAIGDYLETGRYVNHLAGWIDEFGADNVLVLLYDDLRADGAATARQLFTFAGVDPDVPVPEGGAVNRSGIPDGVLARTAYAVRNRLGPAVAGVLPAAVKRRIDSRLQRHLVKEALDPTVRRTIIDREYRAEIEALADLLGRPLDHWMH